MSPSTKFALLLALAIHAAVGFAVKLSPVPPPAKPAENYVEVVLYDPPPPSEPAPPVEVPPPPDPPVPDPPPTPIPPEMAPDPAPVEPKQEPALVIPEPEATPVPKPTPKPVAKPAQKAEPAKPKSTGTVQPAASPNPKSTNATGGGNSYQAVNSVSFLNRRTPTYPPDALRNKQTGRAVLLLYINEFGTVDRVEMVTSSGIPSLDAAATAAAKKSTFRPAVSGGRPVKSKAKVPFNFQINP